MIYKKKKKTLNEHPSDKSNENGEREGEREWSPLTRTSKDANFSRNHETKPSTEAASDTSSCENQTWRPWDRSDSDALIPRSPSRAVRTTVSPNSASRLTIAKPIPLFAPVTTATVSLDHHLHIIQARSRIRGFDTDDGLSLEPIIRSSFFLDFTSTGLELVSCTSVT